MDERAHAESSSALGPRPAASTSSLVADHDVRSVAAVRASSPYFARSLPRVGRPSRSKVVVPSCAASAVSVVSRSATVRGRCRSRSRNGQRRPRHRRSPPARAAVRRSRVAIEGDRSLSGARPRRTSGCHQAFRRWRGTRVDPSWKEVAHELPVRVGTTREMIVGGRPKPPQALSRRCLRIFRRSACRPNSAQRGAELVRVQVDAHPASTATSIIRHFSFGPRSRAARRLRKSNSCIFVCVLCRSGTTVR